jgi:hypothetical protein
MFTENTRAAFRACEVLTMRFGHILVASAALMAVSTAAVAFQEQQGGATSAPAQAPVSESAKPDLGFSSGEGLKSEKGAEVRIPGLGKLGVLPKMDFGLELLYGAAPEPKSESARPDTTSEDSDLRIRGTVKHRF